MFNCKNIVKLSIRYCAELEKLPDLIGPISCLKRIIIDGCGNLKYLRLNGLENLESVSGNLELKKLYVIECPVLEELPSLAKMGCWEKIKIDSCEKLQKITLPTTLTELNVQSCRDLRSVAVAGDLTELTQQIIKQCPALEELPSFGRSGYLKQIKIESCEKLQNITLPTTRLYITVCPKLDLRCLSSLIYLQETMINSCEKLQIITLPTILFKLNIQNCRDLQRVAGTSDLIELKSLAVRQCPVLEELSSPSRLSCSKRIVIESCDKLQD